ncbi:MAG: 3-oxoadipate enol-lactonase [Actinomycetota bacterium]|nr:3-oxoadipate enol-lactonase [Actinomycetota bacterium]
MTPVAVHHVVEGRADAPVVLLIGSLGSTLGMWEPQVDALAEHFRVVRYDARGHGRSPVPPGPYALDDLVDDALTLLDRLGVRRACVIGLSLGGMTALRLAAREPERVDRLAVLCTSALLGPSQAWHERAALVRAHGVAAVADAVVSRWFTEQTRSRDPQLVESMRAVVAATPAEGYAACCEALAVMDLRDDLPTICAPSLVVAGAEDPATPPEHLKAVAAAIPDARLVVLPGAAHLANWEQALAVNAALLTHLPSGATDASRRTAGMRVRREVLGDAHVDRAVAGTTAFSRPFQDLITRHAWGDVWSRPGLDRRTRSMLTLALLTALGHERELAVHLGGAIRNGVTADEIAEVLLHTSVYAGVPAVNAAFAAAQRALSEPGVDGQASDGPPFLGHEGD